MSANRPVAFSRRTMLGLLGAAGMAACDVSTDTGQPGSVPIDDVDITFPKNPAIPQNDVQLNWMENGDLKVLYSKPMLTAYEEQHPNVRITYDNVTPDRLTEVLPLAIRNDTAPDVFAKPNAIPVQVAIKEGWVRPIDDLVPDFARWKAAYPTNAFIEGVHSFDGRTYTFPFSTSKRFDSMLFFDPERVGAADVDPAADRLTWTTFRQACRAITKQGKGSHYGLMTSTDQLGGGMLAAAAGWHSFDWRTGRYAYTAPELEAAIELLLAIKSDGSIFPGFLSQNQQEARARMPQRAAAMLFDGAQSIPTWQASDPSYVFDLALPPTGDDGQEHTATYTETGTGFVYVYSKTTNAKIVGDIFRYIGSVEGQTAMVLLSKGNLGSVLPEVNRQTKGSKLLDPMAVKAVDLADDVVRAAPMVEVRNSDAAMVTLELEPVSPDLNEIGEGIFSGQIRDIGGALRKLNDDSERALDAAVHAAQQKGAEISRDDWVFPNWDPARDYRADDYNAL